MKKNEIRVIVKKPQDRTGAVRTIPNTLEALQKLVGGMIEVVGMGDFLIICNEEGRLLGFSENIWPDGLLVPIVGPIVVVGRDGEEFTDCPLTFGQWMHIVQEWRE